MSLFHIEPDELWIISNVLNQHAHIMLDINDNLNRASGLLDMAWQGNSANDFLNELEQVQNTFRGLTQELFILSQRINHEADRWEESDQIWVQEYRKIFNERINFGG